MSARSEGEGVSRHGVESLDACRTIGRVSCSICGDEAAPARVLSVDRATATARVETRAGVETVALDLVENVRPGGVVMVHLGFAIGVVEAAR